MPNRRNAIECQNEKSGFEWKSALISVLIVLLAGFVRFVSIGRFELWADECSSVLTALSPDFRATLVQENNPPAYYLFLRWWCRIFGIGEVSVRLPSAIAGVGAVT